MPLTLSSIAPSTICYIGGESVTLSGTFATGVAYNVRIGSASCISGVTGQGTQIYSYDGVTLTAFAPALGVSTIYDVTAHDPSGGISTLPGALTAAPQFYLSEIFSLRSILPNNYALGPRSFFTLPTVTPQ